jgi:hypothetical protein
LFQANDRGSRIALPELISANGPVNWNVRSIPSIVFQARGGATVELPKLTTLTGRTSLRASGSGSVLNAPNLANVTGPESDFISSIEVSGASEIALGGNVSLTRCNVTVEAPGTLRAGLVALAENSSLIGTGTVAANLANRGSTLLDRPGALVSEGNVEWFATSVLDVTIGIGAGRAEAGRMETRGDIALNGTLRISPARGFTPAAGQQFDVATFAKPPSGAFSQVDDSSLGAGLRAELVLTSTSLQIRILARP